MSCLRFPCLAVWGCLLALGCETEETSNYNPTNHPDRVNCAGGAQCEECCNDKVCAVGAECQTGGDEGDRVILFCDGPEDCGEGKSCCVGRPSDGALIGRCTSGAACANGEAKLCHSPNDCDGANCGAFQNAQWVGICEAE